MWGRALDLKGCVCGRARSPRNMSLVHHVCDPTSMGELFVTPPELTVSLREKRPSGTQLSQLVELRALKGVLFCQGKEEEGLHLLQLGRIANRRAQHGEVQTVHRSIQRSWMKTFFPMGDNHADTHPREVVFYIFHHISTCGGLLKVLVCIYIYIYMHLLLKPCIRSPTFRLKINCL